MDGVSALSLAASIITVVDFGLATTKKCIEIYQSPDGTLSENLHLERVTADLSRLVKGLQQSKSERGDNPSDNDQALQQLSAECIKTSEHLLQVLDKLKVSGTHRKWKTLRKLFHSAWAKREIETAATTLSAYRQALDTRILVDLRYRLDPITLRRGVSMGAQNPDFECLLQTLLQNSARVVHGGETLKQLQEQSERIANQVASEGGRTRDALADQLEALRMGKQDLLESRRLQIRQSLFFEAFDRRHEEIDQAIEGTYEWIFTRARPNRTVWHNFVQWLEKEQGVYWINGKAGSGKSTLLKFIHKDYRTRSVLEVWSRSNELVTAKSFFWNTGDELQKSLQGMLRSLLYQVFEKSDQLIDCAFPTSDAIWKVLDLRDHSSKDIWTERRLLSGFNRLLTHDSLPVKVCLFVDGLDEFEGDYEALVTLVKTVSSSRSVKICISSRPWQIFHDAFSRGPSLRLQDLTKSDIALFVDHRFRTNEQANNLLRSRRAEASGLVDYIVDNAQGVFIWVVLVVRSLLTGLRNFDTIQELFKRLRELPKDVNTVYELMLSRQEPRYYRQACKLFAIMTATAKPLSLATVCLAEKEQPNFLFSWPPLNTNRDYAVELWPTQVRLTTRCMGMIEVHDKRVRFLHQSVKNFLEQDHVRKGILRGSSDESFDPHLKVLTAYIVQLNTVSEADGRFPDWISRILDYARFVEKEVGRTYEDVLDEFDRRVRLLSGRASAKPLWTDFIAEATEAGLVLYVKAKIQKEPGLLKGDGRTRHPLLHRALIFNWTIRHNNGLAEFKLQKDRGNPRDFLAERIAMIKMLLEEGADPNEEHGGCTARELYEEKLREMSEVGDSSLKTLETLDL